MGKIVAIERHGGRNGRIKASNSSTPCIGGPALGRYMSSGKNHRRRNLLPKVVISAWYSGFEIWAWRSRSSPKYGVYYKVPDLRTCAPAGMRHLVAIRE